MALIPLSRAPPEKAVKVKSERLLTNYLSTLLLTVTNPLTILMFTAVFAGFGVALSGFDQAAIITIGVFLGSACWWIILTFAVGLLREGLTPNDEGSELGVRLDNHRLRLLIPRILVDGLEKIIT